MEHDSDLLTVTAFAREAGAHPHTVSNYERRGDLKATRASNGIRLFRRSDIPKLRQLIAEGIARRPLGEARCLAQALALLERAKGASCPVLATLYTVGLVRGAGPDESYGHPALATLHKVGDRVLSRWVYTGDALPEGCPENRAAWVDLFLKCQADAAELARLNQ